MSFGNGQIICPHSPSCQRISIAFLASNRAAGPGTIRFVRWLKQRNAGICSFLKPQSTYLCSLYAPPSQSHPRSHHSCSSSQKGNELQDPLARRCRRTLAKSRLFHHEEGFMGLLIFTPGVVSGAIIRHYQNLIFCLKVLCIFFSVIVWHDMT
ncbi:hypothetical protein F5Y16DRAFT_59276 [Xylariaceae sp. FL0255]|nr:hypothetical protein F5Y16DRAFT_59276 [Xylariaceae sp. FL0255]